MAKRRHTNKDGSVRPVGDYIKALEGQQLNNRGWRNLAYARLTGKIPVRGRGLTGRRHHEGTLAEKITKEVSRLQRERARG